MEFVKVGKKPSALSWPDKFSSTVNPHASRATPWLTRIILALATPEKFVSRGGYKLEHALLHFQLASPAWTAIDLGASTGGFTDCLLQAGVGKKFMPWMSVMANSARKLRRDERVVVMEKTNARHLTQQPCPRPFSPVDLVVIDCSFISLRKILPPAVALLRATGKILALIKPQFEAGKEEADKGAGVITDQK